MVVVVVVVVGGTVVVVVVVVVVVGGTVVDVVDVAIETHCSRRPFLPQSRTPVFVIFTRPSVVHDPPGSGAATTDETGTTSRVSAIAATAPRNNLTLTTYIRVPKLFPNRNPETT
jgi:hypothetical protein